MTPMTPMAPAIAEREILERLQETTEVRTTPPEPGIGEYFTYLVQQLTAWVKGLLTSGAERIGLDDPVIQHLVATVLLWGAALLAAAALAHLLYRLVRHQRRHPRHAATAPMTAAPPREAVAADPEDWRRRLQARLAAGDPLGALEALWWWLGTHLAGDRLDPTWTSGELLHHTDQRALRPAVHHLDRLRYGPGSPALAAVAELSERLQQRLEIDRSDRSDRRDRKDGRDDR